jgi:hypothetical protein
MPAIVPYPSRFSQRWMTAFGLLPIPTVATDVVLQTTYIDTLFISNPSEIQITVWLLDKGTPQKPIAPGTPCDPGQIVPIPMLGVPAENGFTWEASDEGALGWISGRQP